MTDVLHKIEKERKKLQTEKIEYNKWLREESRDELIWEKISNAIESLDPLPIPLTITSEHSKKEYALAFGDEHYSIEFEIKDLFGNIINSYSPEIFEERMWELLKYVLEIVDSENINILNVFSLGDFCDGVLRESQLMKLRYGVVDGTIRYADFICNWLTELSRYVRIKFQMTDGNHTELRMLGQPKGTFTEDNMGKVVKEFIKVRMKDNPNFVYLDNPTGYIYAMIAGYNVLGIHGEVKSMSNAIKDFTSLYQVPIDYLIAGHCHHTRKESVGIDNEVINIPSIIGTDPYALSLRKANAPAAKLMVFERLRGLTCEYNLRLLK